MSGLYSRRKGMTFEYKIRDLFRAWGYDSFRVPASGAAQGFKGDVLITKGHRSYKIEAKSRAKEFDWLYKALPLPNGGRADMEAFSISMNADPMVKSEAFIHVPFETLARMEKMFTKYIGESDILVVKSDRKPPIFIRRRFDESFSQESKVS